MAKTNSPDSVVVTAVAPPEVGGIVRGRLTPQPGAVVTDNEYGIDVLVRTYFAMVDEIYKLAPKKGDKDKWLPQMVTGGRAFSEGKGLTASVTLTCYGLLDDKLPDLKVKGGWKESTVSLPTTTIFGGPAAGILIASEEGGNARNLEPNGEASITYRAPTTDFIYVTRKAPSGPAHVNEILAAVADIQIVDVRPAGLLGRPIGELVIRTTRFDVEKFGSYYGVAESNAVELVSVASVGLSLQRQVDELDITLIT